MRVGLIGYGAIARGLCALVGPDEGIEIVGALVADSTKARSAGSPPMCATLGALLDHQPEVVVESGGHTALACHGPGILRTGIDVLMLSYGALADPAVEQAIIDGARAGRCRAIVVSGAIGGLDALAAAAVGGLSSVVHTTRKPARALLPPDEAAVLDAPRELFRGTARDAAPRFPESINVAAAVSLAGLGFDRTQVVVIADPTIQRNQHEVAAQGKFGEFRFEIRNVPSADNPRTGKLVAMSVLHALRKREQLWWWADLDG